MILAALIAVVSLSLMATMVHSRIGASSSHRWLVCPGSVRLEASAPEDVSSKAAERGTTLHACGEWALRSKKAAAEWSKSGAEGAVELTPEEISGVQLYVDEVRNALVEMPGGELHIEEHIQLAHIHPDMFGTGDAAIVIPFRRGRIFDLKGGAGYFVEVENNPQLAFYAIAYAHRYDLVEVDVTIVQPFGQGDPVRTVRLDAAALTMWEQRFRSAIARVLDPEAPLVPSAVGCRWCRAAATCPALKREVDARLPSAKQDVETLAPEALARALEAADLLELWIGKVRGAAWNHIALGGKLPGWVLKEGRPGNRQYQDEHAALIALTAFAEKTQRDTAALTRTRIASPADVEAAWGKAKAIRELLESITVRPTGSPKLVRQRSGDFDAITSSPAASAAPTA